MILFTHCPDYIMDFLGACLVVANITESMIQSGPCVKRIIATLADNYNPNQPLRFDKLVIKDGFWRIQVNGKYSWNFDYVVLFFALTISVHNITIVVPNCLLMGW